MLLVLTVASGAGRQARAQTTQNPYPSMAPIDQYLIADRNAEVALARSAAPDSVAEHAEVLVLGRHGYETAVKGTNGFVCLVGRSWALGFDKPEFWNPKIRSALCVNSVSARSVLPLHLARTEWVLAAVAIADMKAREDAEWASGKYKAPEPGAMSFMLSRQSYLNDDAGPWLPHVMFFAPRSESGQWGENLPGSPVRADTTNFKNTTVFNVLAPKWSDGTPSPADSQPSGPTAQHPH
ncbi:MAG: hypothetical protein ACRD16_05155 [Thermoanaerobaculia bacterium]